MAQRHKASTLDDPFKLTILIFSIIAFMYFSAEVLKPLALSILLSFALAPPVARLQRIGLNRVASVVLTVVLALGLLSGLGYVVGRQLTTLANRLPHYQGNIESKLSGLLRPGQETAADKLSKMSESVMAKLKKEEPKSTEVSDGSGQSVSQVQRVAVVEQPSFQERLRTSAGPYLEFLGVGSFVLILVLFILIGQEDLVDRIVSLFGNRQVSLTTRTTEEIGQRVSRYLATFALMNSAYGLVIGVGLALIGVPYAVLWGCLAALTRFIPYVGPAVGFLLPFIFSFASSEDWYQPILVLSLFGLIETALNSFLEPIIYGKTTGVSALGLLVAAMFWTWLWGTLGLLLSTPLTVCLAVMGKYVPGLRFFATLLGEEADLEPYLRFYQRLVALDRDGATELIEDELKTNPRIKVYDEILIPSLILAERDSARGELEEREQAFIWQVIEEIIENLDGVPEHTLDSVVSTAQEKVVSDASQVEVLGLSVVDRSDELVLKMLGQVLAPVGCHLEILSEIKSPLQLVEKIGEQDPQLLILSHVPPQGLAQSRYLVQRLRARFDSLPIFVGRWGETAKASSAAERLSNVGASQVIFTLVDARERVLAKLFPETEQELGKASEPQDTQGTTVAPATA